MHTARATAAADHVTCLGGQTRRPRSDGGSRGAEGSDANRSLPYASALRTCRPTSLSPVPHSQPFLVRLHRLGNWGQEAVRGQTRHWTPGPRLRPGLSPFGILRVACGTDRLRGPAGTHHCPPWSPRGRLTATARWRSAAPRVKSVVSPARTQSNQSLMLGAAPTANFWSQRHHPASQQRPKHF